MKTLASVLSRLGIRTVWASPSAPVGLLGGAGGLDVRTVADPELAALLGDAEGALGPEPGCSLDPAGRLRVSSRPGVAAASGRTKKGSIEYLLVAAVDPARRSVVSLDFSDAGDRPVEVAESAGPERPRGGRGPGAESVVEWVEGLGRRPLVLAGPGVVRTPGAVAALARLAGEGRLGVVNTWGAKGLFDWQSPHHLGTAGLQADDFALAGLNDAEAVLATGLDPDESPRARWDAWSQPTMEVAPHLLGELEGWPTIGDDTSQGPERPPLYTRLAAALAPHYEGEVPGSPAECVLATKADLATDDVVVADPGPAGLWVARTFPTSVSGSVIVPATRCRGIAAAAAWVAATRGLRALAVTTGPVDSATRRVMEAAAADGVEIDLRVWGPDSSTVGSAHPCDFELTRDLVAVAGPVVAWT